MIRSSQITMLLTLLMATTAIYSQNKEKADPVLRAIKRNDTLFLSGFLATSPVDAPYGENQQTLMTHAIAMNKPRVAEFLLNHHADPDFISHDYAPLQLAARFRRSRIVKILLEAGANPNITDSLGNTPLFAAASQPGLRTIKLLVKHGAWVRYYNRYHLSPAMIASLSGNPRNAAYLRNFSEINLPSWFDGPYADWKSNDKLRITYLLHDSLSRSTRKTTQDLEVNTLPFKFKGLNGDTNSYTIQRDYQPESTIYPQVPEWMALGDIHGDFDNLSSFLKNQHIINKNLDWNWGSGHLVLLGDIFDRGEKVTECFWLINKIQRQAREAGGQVHVILGNHEVMELHGDYRYLNEKYLILNERLHMNYAARFGPKTELGRWIRTFNTMEIIDSVLFVHAGIHPYLQEIKLEAEPLNSIIHQALSKKQSTSLSPLQKWLLDDTGPLWFRGYFNRAHWSVNPVSEEKLQEILRFYHVKRIIIGHTNVSQITSLYHGKVIAMDIPYYQGEGIITGLLYSGDSLSLAFPDGSLQPFFP